MFLDPHLLECTICTAVAPEAVVMVRMCGLMAVEFPAAWCTDFRCSGTFTAGHDAARSIIDSK